MKIMKQLSLVLGMLIFYSLFSTVAYSQSCTGNTRSASCYVNGVEQHVSGAWQVNCPTGNFRYNLSAECSSSAYYSEAALWGDITSAYVNATAQNQSVYDYGSVSGLDPNFSYWVELLVMTSGPGWSSAYASADIYTW